MASLSEIRFAAAGIAYKMGCENFDAVMPRQRCYAITIGLLRTKGFKYVEENAVAFIAKAACRLGRQGSTPCETPYNTCRWRKTMASEWACTPRPTALRIEALEPADRCGYLLKDGYLGGAFFDYEACHRRATITILARDIHLACGPQGPRTHNT